MDPRTADDADPPGQWGLVAVAWTLVSAPLAWGVWMTFQKALLLFSH